jgi:hypothetical protein
VILELMEKLKDFTYISILDLKKSYLQWSIDEDSRDYLSFTSKKHGKLRFTRMPFGLKIAPSSFQERMEIIFQGLLWEKVLVYIDDIIIFTLDSLEDHISVIDLVLQKLEEYGLKINKEKSIFAKKEGNYLGFYITSEGYRLSDKRLEAFKNAQRPSNKDELRSFLGCFPFYGILVNTSELLSPLYQLLKKNVKFEWTEECEDAFIQAKEIFIGKMNAYFDPKKPIILKTDASGKSIAGVLEQEGKIIFTVSRSLTDTEKRYSTIERELLAIVFSIKKLRRYLFGIHFEVFTDHKPLVGLFVKRNVDSKRLENLLLKVQDYDFEVSYIPGKANYMPDILSRTTLIHYVEESERFTLIDAAHRVDDLHHGYNYTLDNLKGFSWRGKIKDVKDFLLSCECAKKKENLRSMKGNYFMLDVARFPMEILAMDLYEYCDLIYLSMLDYYSDLLFVKRVDDKTGESIKEASLVIWSECGKMPVRIVSDRGTEFNWIEKMGILHSRTSAYTPELNGRLERKHKELSKICRILDVSVEEAANKLNTDEELKRFNEECIDQVKGLRRGDYVLRYDRTENRPKHKDVWKGPYQIIEILDDRSFELSTGSVVDMRDVKPFKRWFEPTWKIRDEVLIQVCNEFLIEHQKLNDVFDHPNPWIISWNVDSRICFIHCGYRDLFDAILKAQEDKPGKALFVIPQMEEQRYYKFLENLNAVWYDPQEAVFELNGKVIEVPYAVWFVMINHSDWEL